MRKESIGSMRVALERQAVAILILSLLLGAAGVWRRSTVAADKERGRARTEALSHATTIELRLTHALSAAETLRVPLDDEVRLAHDARAFGKLVLTAADGNVVEGVVPVRAFPIAAPAEGIALVGPDGHEAGWIERLDALPAALRQLVEEELGRREFMPEIRRIRSVSSFATPSTWQVDTDRGETSLVLWGEEFIRRLGKAGLLIEDSHGIHFLVRDLSALDSHSRKLLDRFL